MDLNVPVTPDGGGDGTTGGGTQGGGSNAGGSGTPGTEGSGTTGDQGTSGGNTGGEDGGGDNVSLYILLDADCKSAKLKEVRTFFNGGLQIRRNA